MTHHNEGHGGMDRFEEHRGRFQNLDWSRGYTTDELRQQFSDMPQDFWSNFPSGQKFYSFDEFWRHTGQGTGTRPSGQMGGPEHRSGQMGGNR